MTYFDLEEVENIGATGENDGAPFVVTTHSLVNSRSYSRRFGKFESTATFDWPNQMI